jgi:hypothetical protein
MTPRRHATSIGSVVIAPQAAHSASSRAVSRSASSNSENAEPVSLTELPHSSQSPKRDDDGNDESCEADYREDNLPSQRRAPATLAGCYEGHDTGR